MAKVESMRVAVIETDTHTLTTFTPEPTELALALTVRHIADFTGDAACDFEELHKMLSEDIETLGTLDIGVVEYQVLNRAEKSLKSALRLIDRLKKSGGWQDVRR